MSIAAPTSPVYAVLLDALTPGSHGAGPAPVLNRRGWSDAVAAAEWHRLAPLLHRHLGPAGAAPTAVLDRLQQAYLENAARNLFVAASLRAALEALGAAGVRAIMLKGAALIESVYPDPAMRELLDLDLLVEPGGLNAARAALAPLGYRPETATGLPDDRSGHHHEPALVSDRALVAIELHHHIAMTDEGGRFDLGGIWERARGDGAQLLPAPEDLLLHVALHFTRNRLGGSAERGSSAGALAQIGDMAWIIDVEPVDWDVLAATARACGIEARVFLALFAAAEVGVAVPDEVLGDLRPAGFDPRVGRRLVALRVLRTGRQLPVRRLRWIVAPGREALSRGWAADTTAPRSVAAAYARRAAAQAPLVRSALRRPRSLVQDYRLNAQIAALEARR